MGWGMMSEYILGNGFESGGDGGYSCNGGSGSGCLVVFAGFGLLAALVFGLVA